MKLIPYYYYYYYYYWGVGTQANKQINRPHRPISLQKAHGFGFEMTSGATVLQNFIMEESVV